MRAGRLTHIATRNKVIAANGARFVVPLFALAISELESGKQLGQAFEHQSLAGLDDSVTDVGVATASLFDYYAEKGVFFLVSAHCGVIPARSS